MIAQMSSPWVGVLGRKLVLFKLVTGILITRERVGVSNS